MSGPAEQQAAEAEVTPASCAHAFPIGPPHSGEQPGDCERCGRSWASLSDRQQQVMSQGRYHPADAVARSKEQQT